MLIQDALTTVHYDSACSAAIPFKRQDFREDAEEGWLSEKVNKKKMNQAKMNPVKCNNHNKPLNWGKLEKKHPRSPTADQRMSFYFLILT